MANKRQPLNRAFFFLATGLVASLAILVTGFLASASPTAPGLLAGKSANSIFFPADKNGLTILPQRFEYTLYDGYLLKLGDILMDTTQIQFKPILDKNEKVRLRFYFPVGLFKQGQIVLKNNNGKTLWSSSFRDNDLKISAGKEIEDFKDLRNDLAEWTSPAIDSSIIESAKKLPFLNFCIEKKDQETFILICSPELYFNPSSDLSVQLRPSNRKNSLVEINGHTVSDQGIIFLNDAKENVSLRALIKSGANIEIETKMREIEFLDVTDSTDPTKFSILMYGTDPVHEDVGKKLSDHLWRLNLDASRPFVYVMGLGGIPMRQEFYMKSKPPSESLRLNTKKSSKLKTYDDEVAYNVKSSGPIALSPVGKDVSIETIGKDNFRFHYQDLKKGQVNSRKVAIKSKDEIFVTEVKINRAFDSEIAFVAPVSIVPGQVTTEIQYEHWFENLAFTELLEQKMGFTANLGTALSKPNDFPSFNYLSTRLHYRLTAGLNRIDGTWGLSLPVWFYSFSGTNSTSVGLGFYYEQEPFFSFLKYFDWTRVDATYGFLNFGDIKISAIGSSYLTGYKKINTQLSYSLAVGASTVQIETAKKNLNLDLKLGLHYIF